MSEVELRTLLYQLRYCTVSTITTNEYGAVEPHGTIVFFHATSNALYWTSRRTSQHGKNHVENPAAFVTLFEENIREGEGVKKGLYLNGTVRVLTDSEEISAAKIGSTAKANRDKTPWNQLDVPSASQFMDNSVRAVYCFTPKEAWTNIWQRSVGDERVELDLNVLFPSLK